MARRQKRELPELLFHFASRERYNAILASQTVDPISNPSLGGKPGISFTDLDPRTVPWERISMQNWKMLRPWRMEAFVAVPIRSVRRPRQLPVPQNHEWVTTHSVPLGSGCFGGIRTTAEDGTVTYTLDDRPGRISTP